MLTLPIGGARLSKLSVDVHDGEKSAGGGPLLYKEWTFEGRANGTGIFAPGFAAPARYTLIFQGRGNNCDGGDDFRHWRLEIRGAKAEFTFVGALKNEP